MLTTLTHPTLAAIVEAIRADPDDDTVRLALADYLEEGDDPAWAELIRVQVELARTPDCESCMMQETARTWGVAQPVCRKHDPLRARSDDLLREHEARWRCGGKCEECHNGYRFGANAAKGDFPNCPTCHGTGWERWWLAELLPLVDLTPTTIAYGPQGRDFVHRVHFERGFIESVECNYGDALNQTGEPTEWSLAIIEGEPCIRRFVIADRPPHLMNGRWWLEDVSGEVAFEAILMYRSDHPKQANIAAFETRESAELYQSRSVANLVRGRLTDKIAATGRA